MDCYKTEKCTKNVICATKKKTRKKYTSTCWALLTGANVRWNVDHNHVYVLVHGCLPLLFRFPFHWDGP